MTQAGTGGEPPAHGGSAAGAEPAAGKSRRGRGRPPRLSREQIVAAAVSVLEHDPAVPLTIKRVAEAAGSAPMALYRYFPDRDALLQAAADHVLATMERAPIADGPWQERLRSWMRTGLRWLRPYSQLLPYMAATQQPAWIPGLVRISGVLSPAGLDDRDLALAAVLVSSTVMGYAVYEVHRQPAEQAVALLGEALELRPPSEVDAVRPLLAELPQAYARLYETVLDQTVATIERLAGS